MKSQLKKTTTFWWKVNTILVSVIQFYIRLKINRSAFKICVLLGLHKIDELFKKCICAANRSQFEYKIMYAAWKINVFSKKTGNCKICEIIKIKIELKKIQRRASKYNIGLLIIIKKQTLMNKVKFYKNSTKSWILIKKAVVSIQRSIR